MVSSTRYMDQISKNVDMFFYLYLYLFEKKLSPARNHSFHLPYVRSYFAQK